MTTALGATLSTLPPDLNGGTIAMDAVLNPGTEALSGQGSMTPVDAPMGSMSPSSTSGGTGLFLRSGGEDYAIGVKNEGQRKRNEQLHDALTAGCGPDALINVSRGWVEVNGNIVKYLNENPTTASQLHEMRMLYHEILGQRYSDIVWHDYEPNDRASTKDPASFQQRKNIEALKRIPSFPEEEVPKPQVREFHIARKLKRGLAEIFEKQKDHVGTSTEAETRKGQLDHLKRQMEETDELLLSFHSTHPVPDLSALPDIQAKYDALAQYRNDAKAFITAQAEKHASFADRKIAAAFRRRDIDEPDTKKAIDELALEMALTACETRKDYDRMCLEFETKPRGTTPELFLMRLSHLMETDGAVEDHIDKQFDIAFSALTHQVDKDAVRQELNALITRIKDVELNDVRLAAAASPGGTVAEYHQRVEQMELVKKQKAIAEAHTKIAADLRAKRADLAAIAAEINEFGDDDIADRLDGVEQIAEYEPFAKEIQDRVKEQDDLIKQLEAEQDPGLKPFINRMKGLLQDQTAIGTFLSDKVAGFLKRGLNKINPLHQDVPIAQIAAPVA